MDSKSSVRNGREGSSPSSGTSLLQKDLRRFVASPFLVSKRPVGTELEQLGTYLAVASMVRRQR